MNDRTVARFSRTAILLGIVLSCVGLVTQIATLRLGFPQFPWELELASDAETVAVGLWWVAIATRLVVPRFTWHSLGEQREPVYVTRGLVDILLDRAERAEPRRESVGLTTTPARDVDGAEHLPADQPVFTHFIHPSAGGSVRGVFGLDLATAPGRTHGWFVSHPRDLLTLTKRDTLREIVFVAVPPWDDDCLAAFDRSGRRVPFRILDAEPTESFGESVGAPEALA